MESIYNMSKNENNSSRWTMFNASSEAPVLDYPSLAPPPQAMMMMLKVCSPIILVLGTFGNVMTLLILRTIPLGAANVSVFFSALAVSDLVLLYTGLLRTWVVGLVMMDIRDLHDVICKLHMFVMYVASMTSSWFLVTMTLQRVISVLWPHRVARVCTRRKSQVTVVFLVLLFASLNVTLLMTYTVRTTTTGAQQCSLVDDVHLQFYDRQIHTWIDMAMTSFLPSLLLLVGNAVLSVTLYRSVRQAGQLSSQADTATREKAASSLTITLMCVSLAFLCLTLPMHAVFIIAEFVDFSSPWLTFLSTFFHLLYLLNSATNFYFYCLTGSKFRVQCRRLLCLAAPDARAG